MFVMARIQPAALFPQEATLLYCPVLCRQLCCLHSQEAQAEPKCAIPVSYVLVFSERLQISVLVSLIESTLV